MSAVMLVARGRCDIMKSTHLFRPESLPKGHWAVIEDMNECLLPFTQLTAVTSPSLHC